MTVSDVDSPNLAGASVMITKGAQSGDVLSINGATSGTVTVSGGHTIQFSFDSNTHVLSLSGSATLDDYQAVLRTVSFSNSGDNVADSARTISFQVDDGSANNHLSEIATATIALNHSPVGIADVNAVTEDAPSTVVSGNVLSNDTDLDSADTHTVSAVTGATDNGATFTVVGTFGTLVVDKATGAYTYTLANGHANVQALAEGQTATDVFSYTNTDNHGTSGSSTLTINVHGSNETPVAVADINAVTEDAPSTVISGNVLSNDTDIDTIDTHTVSAVAGATDNGATFTVVGTFGTLVVDKATGAYTYTLANGQANVQALAEGQTVTDVFSYTNSDNHGGSASASLTISVHGSNDAPTFSAIAQTVGEDGPTLSVDLLTAANAADPDNGDILSAINADTTIETGGGRTLVLGTDYTVTNGVFELTSAGFAQFNNLSGSQHDSFTLNYQISDGTVALPNTLSVTVDGNNDAPVALPNGFSTTERTIELANIFFKAPVGNLLANDSDPDSGDSLSVASIGSVSVDEHVPGFFIVSIHSETAGSGEVARYEIVTNSGDAHLAVKSDGTVLLWSDTGDDPFRTLGSGQSATINFNYTASDGHGGTDTALASIDIHGSNDAPVAFDNSFSTTERTVELAGVFSKLTIGNVLGNDSDPDSGDNLSVASVSSVSVDEHVLGFSASTSIEFAGSGEVARYKIHTNSGDAHLAVTSDGTVLLWSDTGEDPFRTLALGQSATINFNYAASDGHGGTDTASASIQVNGSNDAPTFSTIARTVGEDGPTLSVNLLAAANATDPDSGNTLSAVNADTTIVTADHRTLHAVTDYTVTSGVFALTAAGFAQFNSLGASQHDSFTVNYRISDGTVSLANTLTVTVNGANDAPAIAGATATGTVPSSAVTATAASYLNATTHDLINTLGGSAGFGLNSLGGNDDGSSGAINLDAIFGASGLNFFGTHYHFLFINNNGNVTFNSPSSTFTPFQINAGVPPMIAPFMADVDTREVQQPQRPEVTRRDRI